MFCEQIFRQDELEMIAGLCRKHDVIVFADEVYEWMVYKPNEHIRIGKFIVSAAKWSKPLMVTILIVETFFNETLLFNAL